MHGNSSRENPETLSAPENPLKIETPYWRQEKNNRKPPISPDSSLNLLEDFGVLRGLRVQKEVDCWRPRIRLSHRVKSQVLPKNQNQDEEDHEEGKEKSLAGASRHASAQTNTPPVAGLYRLRMRGGGERFYGRLGP